MYNDLIMKLICIFLEKTSAIHREVYVGTFC